MAKENLTLHFETQNAAFSKNQPIFDARARLKGIKVPTLVTVGRHDLVCPLEYSEEISREILKSRLVVFEHSGHRPPSDELVAFQKSVKGGGGFMDEGLC